MKESFRIGTSDKFSNITVWNIKVRSGFYFLFFFNDILTEIYEVVSKQVSAEYAYAFITNKINPRDLSIHYIIFLNIKKAYNTPGVFILSFSLLIYFFSFGHALRAL